MASALDMLRSSPARQRFAAMYGADTAAPRPTAAYLDDATKEDMLSYMARQGRGTLATVGRALDTPGAIFRGVLAGDPLSGFSWDDDRRVTGKELLEQYGLLRKDADPWLATGAGLAAEIALDPFAIAKLPLQALTPAGRAAKAAGILDSASDAAVAQMGFDAAVEAAKNTRTGRAAYKFLGDILPGGKGITPENVKYRPLVGPRVARTRVNLEETINAAPNPTRARQEVMDYLKTRGLDYDAVKGQKLGGAFGLGYFNFVDPIVFNPKGAEKYLDALDALGQSARWSAPARFVSRLTDKRVGEAYKPGDQIANMRQFDKVLAEQSAAQVAGSELLLLAKNIELPDQAKKILGAENLTEEGGRRFVRRFMEGTQTQSDMRLREIIGPKAIDDLVGKWDEIKSRNFSQGAALGMRASKTMDKYGVLNSPRKALELDFGEYGTGAGRRIVSARTIENELRNPLLLSPGGTDDLEEASLLPIVQQFISEGRQSQLSVTEVAKKVKEFIDKKHGPNAADPRVRPFKTFVPQLGPDGKPIMVQAVDAAGNPQMIKARTKTGKIILDKATGQPKMIPKMVTVKSPNEVITMNQAEAMVRAMMRRRDDLPAGIGLFSEHPLKAQVRTAVNQAGARANARHVYESVGESAIFAGPDLYANAIPGTRFKPMDKAINELARDLGLSTSGGQFASDAVKENVRAAIAKANNIADPSTVELSRYAMPEEVFDRLRRTRDFYSTARAQKDVENLFDGLTTLFKGFALAFPSTKVRDFYGNTFLVWTQVGNVADVAGGMAAANKVLAGKVDEAAELLKKIPSYQNLTPVELQKAIARDVSETNILRSLSSNDLITSNRSAQLNQFVPGINPIRAGDAIRELIPDGSRSLTQMLGDQAQIARIRLPGQKTAAFETRNALLNASQKASDWTDSVARLGGMFALMRQGVSAREAAKRVTSALVDYSSLTTWERNTARRVFLWWSFQSRIGKYVAQQLAMNPGGAYAQTIRGFNTIQRSDDDVYIPEALRQQFAFRVPEAVKPYLGIDPNKTDTTTFLKDIDIPGFDVLSLFDSGNPTIYGKVQGTAFNLLQQAHPLTRSTTELMTGIDTFSRRPLEQAVTPLDRLYMRAFNSATPMNPLLRQAINLTPGPQQRLIPILGGLADQRIPMQQRIAKQTFNALAGMKLQDVDPAWQLQDARRVLGQQLGGFMQDYTESYIPEDVLPQLPMELMPQYQLFRTLGRDLREARK